MGRVKRHVDYEMVETLASFFCTVDEICSVMNICRTVADSDKRFREAYERGLTKAKASLRRKQWELAKQGNVTMLIWLGKQYLEQSDYVRSKQESMQSDEKREQGREAVIKIVYPKKTSSDEDKSDDNAVASGAG